MTTINAMEQETDQTSLFKPAWLIPLALIVLLYLMYSSTFLTDYLMNDELGRVSFTSGNLVERIPEYFFRYGRGLFGIYQEAVYGFAGSDPFKIQVVRFFNLVSITTIAVILFKFMERYSRHSFFAFFVIMLFFSQPAFQGIIGYGLQLVSNTQPAMWLSLLAFYLYFFIATSEHFPGRMQVGIVFLVLMLAMQSTQTYAFFSVIPLTYLALADWKNQKGKVWRFLLIAAVVFVISSIVYKIGLEYWHTLGREGYKLGEQGLTLTVNDPIRVLRRVLNPLAYWSSFKLWSYPFPFHYTLPLWTVKRLLAYLILVIWGVLVVYSVAIELRGCLKQERWQLLLKWLSVCACLGFGAIFLIVDSPIEIKDHRPHMTMTFVGVIIFSGAYSLQLLASKHRFLRSNAAKATGIFLVLMIAFGAQAGVLRGIVHNRMAQLDFIRTELMAKEPSTYDTIIVVVPDWRGGCITEPCDIWLGQIMDGVNDMSRPGVYQYALTTTGISPEEKDITIVREKPNVLPPNAVIIDWNKFILARIRYREYLQQKD